MTASEAQHEQQSPATAEGGAQSGEGRNRRRRRRGGRRPGEARQDGQEVTQSEQPQREADNTPAESSESQQQGADGERRGRNRRRNRRGRGAEAGSEGTSEIAQEPTGAEGDQGVVPAPKAPPAQQQKPKQGQPQQQQSKKQQDQPKKERPPRGSVLNRRQTRGDYDDAPKAKEEAPAYVPVVAATVDAYVTQHRGWQRDVLASLRSLIKSAVPDIEETIMWSQPVFLSNGPVCFIKAYAEAVHFGFWRGTELEDSEGLLTGDLTKMRHIAIKSAKEIKSDVFEAMVRQATKLNRDKGDPTLS